MTGIYKKSGVDIDAGNSFVDKIKPFINATKRRGVVGKFGGFGGFFALDVADMKEPILVSGTDGVGTKLKIAIDMKALGTIGIDLVAMCVNDIACSGAEPLFFLDYFATPKLKPDVHAAIVEGISKACKETNCALIGGETAEMPDIYQHDDFDLAGFAVGIVDKKNVIDGSDISTGNAIVGLASSGFHSNGYSLIRYIIKEKGLSLDRSYPPFDKPLGEILLTPTKLYSPLVGKLKKIFNIKGIAHITGGGFLDNIPRILPKGVEAVIDKWSFEVPKLFRFFQEMGSIDEQEFFRVFNCGIGMVFIVPAEEAGDLINTARVEGYDAYQIGTTRKHTKGSPRVVME